MAPDSRSRPMRRPARRRLPALTALVLLTMVAGFWAWLFAPAAPQATTVAAPRLQVEAVQIDATEQDEDPVEYAEHAQTAAGDSAPSEPDTAPRIGAGEAPLSGTTPVAAGPRAPPAAS